LFIYLTITVNYTKLYQKYVKIDKTEKNRRGGEKLAKSLRLTDGHWEWDGQGNIQ